MIALNSFLFYSVGILLCAVILAGVISFFTGLCALPYGRHIKKLIGISLIAMLVGAVSAHYIAFVHGQSAIIADSGIVKDFSKDTIMWSSRWDALMKTKGAHLVYYAEYDAQISMGTHLIIGDPNVRSLTISISVSTSETPKDIIGLEEATGSHAPSYNFSDHSDCYPQYVPLQQYVQSLMYEFNDKHSDQLVPFYNPVDPDQQARFAKVMQDYLGEPLAKAGAHLTGARFYVND